MLRRGLSLLNDDVCPLCRHPWARDVLRESLSERLMAVEAADKRLGALRGEQERWLNELSQIRANVGNLARALDSHEPEISDKLRGFEAVLKDNANRAFPDPLDELPKEPPADVGSINDEFLARALVQLHGRFADQSEPQDHQKAWSQLQGVSKGWRELCDAEKN